MNEEICTLKSCELRQLCIDEQWFTSGSIAQYEKMFDRLNKQCPFEELVIIIWICSDNVTKEQIRYKIHEKEIEVELPF